MAVVDVTEYVRLSGSGKSLSQEIGQFTIPGTNIHVLVPTDLTEVYHAEFNVLPGTTFGTLGFDRIAVSEAAAATATGVVTVTGTALSVTRQVEIGGTAEALRVSYCLTGKS